MPEHADVFLQAARYQQAGPQTRTPDAEWFDRLMEALAPAYRGEADAADSVRAAAPKIQEALDRAWRAHGQSR
jgi:hypothetical protein